MGRRRRPAAPTATRRLGAQACISWFAVLSRALPVISRLRRLRADPDARNSACMVTSYASLTVLQGALFFLLAWALGAHEFGKVASVVAITSALLPWSGLGLGAVATMRIARSQVRPQEALGNGLAVTTVTAVAGVGLALLIGYTFLGPAVIPLLILFGISEILLTKYVDIAIQVFLGLEQHAVSALFQNLVLASRLACAAPLVLGWIEPTALAWAQLHLLAGAFAATVVLLTCVRRLGWPAVRAAAAWQDARKGIHFSVVTSARSVHTDADKMVMARLASESMAGAYTAAFRIVPMVCLPFLAILYAQTARRFRRGEERGVAGTTAAVRQLALTGAAFCLLLAPAIHFAAPLLPRLLGASYQLSAEILQALCLLPFFLVMQSAGSDALVGANAQRLVGRLHALAAALALALNLLLVPRLGWEGAVIAAYASQGFLAAGLAFSIAAALRTQRKVEPGVPAASPLVCVASAGPGLDAAQRIPRTNT
jgi:O-antigen/teichoic acid export membrane protein